MAAKAIATLGEALCEARALLVTYCDARRKPFPPEVLITRLREILDDETVIAAMTDLGYSYD